VDYTEDSMDTIERAVMEGCVRASLDKMYEDAIRELTPKQIDALLATMIEGLQYRLFIRKHPELKK
jgi:hypothetical protein